MSEVILLTLHQNGQRKSEKLEGKKAPNTARSGRLGLAAFFEVICEL